MASNKLVGKYSKIQKFSTKDGFGIRGVVFLKGCTLHCSWCSNPELIDSQSQLLYYGNKCTNCGRCINICNHNAVTRIEGRITFNKSVCVHCRECETYCPADAIEIIGKEITPEKLAQELLKDKVFYDVSGGGVTFSGGEPLVQDEFIKATAKILKEQNIHIAVETCGNIPFNKIENVLDYIDQFLYDIKIFDNDLHFKYTGSSNHLIKDNLKRIIDREKDIVFRLILVPNVNNTEKELRDRFDLIQSLSINANVDILMYHELGLGKYQALSEKNAYKTESYQNENEKENVISILKDYDFNFSICN